MENASKALIIAGAIILSLVIISLGMFIFSKANDLVNSIDMSDQEIKAFNNKFTPYEGENVRGSQVNALIQAVASNNQSAEDNGESTTKGITIDGSAGISILPGSIKGSVGKVKPGTYYEVKLEYEKSLVHKITINNKSSLKEKM